MVMVIQENMLLYSLIGYIHIALLQVTKTNQWDYSSAFLIGLKIIYTTLLNWTMEEPFSKFNALLKFFLTPTEILHFDW